MNNFDELVKRNNTLSLRIEELEQKNEELKEKIKVLDAMTGIFSVRLANKYKQALEKIREEIIPVCSYCSNIDGFSTWEDCENVCEKGVIKYLKIIDEVLE